MVTMICDVGLVMALQVGGAIGVLLTLLHHQRSAAREQAYEREVAQDAALYAAAQATAERYMRRGPRNRTQAAP
jgi:hypothetical protein